MTARRSARSATSCSTRLARIEAYVISVGGFLGMGAKEVALSPRSFAVEPGSAGEPDKLKLSMNQNELAQAAELCALSAAACDHDGVGAERQPAARR